jgi:cobalt-precorrin 5A hydrolase / cobalt-factor III methyltransferase / precorrin-3B C17-methyltransferase
VIGLVAATRNGRRMADHLAGSWPDALLYDGRPREALERAWKECDGVVLFVAAGAAVRLLAPLLADKRRDPGVVCVDDAGRYAVSLVGGHGGGANALAGRVADSLGAAPVLTTASESAGVPALDSFGAEIGLEPEDGSDLASVGAALVSGEEVRLVSDRRWPLGPLPQNVVPSQKLEPPLVLISDELATPPRPAAIYRPPSLAVGVGCSLGTSPGEILDLLSSSLRRAGLAEKSVALLASVEAKSGERGLLAAAQELGVSLRFFPAARLAQQEAPNPSAVVESAVGTPSVAEASVLACGAELILEKAKSENATVAVGRLAVRGRLALVSLGPGDDALIPPLARETLRASQLIVGLGQYVDRVRHLLRPGTRTVSMPLGDEISRARRALEEARAGGSVALVSGGDVGIYAMASPALELATDDVDVTVIPGITAAQAAASLLGSPLGHDHCSISLSDLLTPWETILNRLRAAAAGDFVISLYNPRSKVRDWQLAKTRDLLLEHRSPDTPVGIVRDAYRPARKVVLTDLASLRPEDADMRTIIVIGNSRTELVAGRMVTPRGYLP